MNPTDWVHGEEPAEPETPSVPPAVDAAPRVPSKPTTKPTTTRAVRAAIEKGAPQGASPSSGVEPLSPDEKALRQTKVSEVTRHTWALCSLLSLECMVLAGLSAVFNARRARRNLIGAALLALFATGLTVAAGYVITRWGGFPRLMVGDYLWVALRAGAFPLGLLVLLVAPPFRRYSLSVSQARRTARRHSWSGRVPVCALLMLLLVAASLIPALTGQYLSASYAINAAGEALGTTVPIAVSLGLSWFVSYTPVPGWEIIRQVLMGWSVVAAVLALLILTRRRTVVILAYVVVLLGLLAQVLCWGAPFVVVGAPEALDTLLLMLPLHLIVLGRLRSCMVRLRAERATTEGLADSPDAQDYSAR